MMTCPLRMDPEDDAGCYRWREFVGDFEQHWARWFDAPPTLKHWQAARRDWRKGNTGYEAAHIAQARAKERAAKASATPLVWLGGRHYAPAGSALAIKYGRPKPAEGARSNVNGKEPLAEGNGQDQLKPGQGE